MREQRSVVVWHSLAVERGDVDDGSRGLQRALAQDPTAILLGWHIVVRTSCELASHVLCNSAGRYTRGQVRSGRACVVACHR